MLVKRIFDLFGAICGLILLAPLFIVIAFLIKLTSPGPVFFQQTRVGKYGKTFTILKFRTMVVDISNIGPKITVGNDNRITKIGYFLRKSKLDELPQLINVFCGHMSIVGPRPEVPEYVALYPEQIKQIVLSVRPGITDWASIKMIDESIILATYPDPKEAYIKKVMPEKLAYAVKYVKTMNFIQDLIIILVTFMKIMKR